MIVRNDLEQWIGCDICEEVVELRRKTRTNPELLLLLTEQMTREHAGCASYKGNPEAARRSRDFDKRLQAENARAAKTKLKQSRVSR